MSEPNEIGTQSKTETRLLTYNIFMRPPFIKNNVSDFKEFRLSHFIKFVLPNYDIICLEEMFDFGSNRRTRLLEAASKAGFKYTLISPTIINLAIDGGLVMLSRFPIIESDILTYPRGVYSDRFCNKGVLYAKIELNQKDIIHLFMTHTQASYVSAPPLTEKSVLVRQEQLSLFRKFIDKCTLKALPEEPIILVGDLNVNSRPQPNSSDPSVVNGDTNEYLNLIKILSGEGIEDNGSALYKNPKIVSVRDMLKEHYGHHPVTFGDVIVADDGSVIPRDTVLTGKDDLTAQASLDYILLIGAGQTKQQVSIDVQRTRIEEFFLNDASAPVTQLSDHYGVVTYLIGQN